MSNQAPSPSPPRLRSLPCCLGLTLHRRGAARGRAAHPGARSHQHGRVHHRGAARPCPPHGAELPALRARGLLYQHADPSRGAELRHPGRRPRRHHLQSQAGSRGCRQRVRQRPAKQARHRGPGAHAGAALGQRGVLHQPGRQPGSRPGSDPLGLRGVRPRGAGDGRHRPHRRDPHRGHGPVQAGCTAEAGDHPERDHRAGAQRRQRPPQLRQPRRHHSRSSHPSSPLRRATQ